MAKFTGKYDETFTVNAPLEKAKAHFNNLDTIVAAYEEIDRHEKLDDKTLRFQLKPMSAVGATFVGKYDCKYEFTSDNVLVWNTVNRDANIDTHARMEFSEAGSNRTRIHYTEEMTCDIPINRLMAKAVKPLVDRGIAKGCKSFVHNMSSKL